MEASQTSLSLRFQLSNVGGGGGNWKCILGKLWYDCIYTSVFLYSITRVSSNRGVIILIDVTNDLPKYDMLVTYILLTYSMIYISVSFIRRLGHFGLLV